MGCLSSGTMAHPFSLLPLPWGGQIPRATVHPEGHHQGRLSCGHLGLSRREDLGNSSKLRAGEAWAAHLLPHPCSLQSGVKCGTWPSPGPALALREGVPLSAPELIAYSPTRRQWRLGCHRTVTRAWPFWPGARMSPQEASKQAEALECELAIRVRTSRTEQGDTCSLGPGLGTRGSGPSLLPASLPVCERLT